MITKYTYVVSAEEDMEWDVRHSTVTLSSGDKMLVGGDPENAMRLVREILEKLQEKMPE